MERVTKSFSDGFQRIHRDFMAAIEGIAEDELRRWYTSLLLNRLMFVYFIQAKGFLDGDPHYLRNRLQRVRELRRSATCETFYRSFLRRLFQDRLGRAEPGGLGAELAALIGRVPYLNGSLFEVHQIERTHPQLDIPDEAFERVFAFFDDFEWHLDDRPLRGDREINPEMLGRILEKYINQRQMGAYYTLQDVTSYISRNTILPHILESARTSCGVAFAPGGEVWRLLADDPDRYIYAPVRKGVDEELPAEIAAGVGDVQRRGGWNKPAPAAFALPTETWREHIARRARCQELRAKLVAGEVHAIDDLITYNLDIERFARDVIERCEGPELLRAFWRALTGVTVLDPTCGSGAFLLAALNLLEPLYEACLERMQAFVAEFDAKGETRQGEEFRAALAQVAQHPNRRYFILKSIIVGNLYGVDIMEEACEIAKLRLLLKLVAQVDDAALLEPLPDIDFNIRAGNALVGFATLDGVRQVRQSGPDMQMRTLAAGDEVALNQRLDALRAELDRYLAREYGVDPDDVSAYGAWGEGHKPFHWFVEFHGIVQARGGFDVIIGNPPYVEYSRMRASYTIRGYETEPCGNLYGMVCERALSLLARAGRFGVLVPLSIISTERMAPLQRLLVGGSRRTWLSSFDVYPSQLFDGAKQRLTIVLTSASDRAATVETTRYVRWKPEERSQLFATLSYQHSFLDDALHAVAKLGSALTRGILQKVSAHAPVAYADHLPCPSFYVHRIPYNYVKAVDFVPHFCNQMDGQKKSEDYKPYYLRDAELARCVLAMLNSNLFFWWWYTWFEGYHCGRHEIRAFPVGAETLTTATRCRLAELADALMADMKARSVIREANYKTTGKVVYEEFYPRRSKPILDAIDAVLAPHYRLSDAELDFLVNFDFKYRGARDGAG